MYLQGPTVFSDLADELDAVLISNDCVLVELLRGLEDLANFDEVLLEVQYDRLFLGRNYTVKGDEYLGCFRLVAFEVGPESIWLGLGDVGSSGLGGCSGF